MKISCVMCVYNTKESYLREAIESILNQTFADFELIIVDDGSNHSHVKETILSYKDERIKYLYQENAGISNARNFGNQYAQGEYVAVMDSDDIALPNRFEEEVRYLDEHPNISAVGGWMEVFPKKSMVYAPETPCILDCLLDSPMAHSTLMWRRCDFEAKKLSYNPRYLIAQDFDMWARALMSGLQFHNIQKSLVKYRVENQGISTIKKGRLMQEHNEIKENVIQFLTRGNNQYGKELKKMIQSITKKMIYFPKIPLIEIRKKREYTRYRLFGVIPLFKKRNPLI